MDQKDRVKFRQLMSKAGIEGVTFGEFVNGFTLDQIPEEKKIEVFRKNVSLLVKAWMLTWDRRKGLKKGTGQSISDMKVENRSEEHTSELQSH